MPRPCCTQQAGSVRATPIVVRRARVVILSEQRDGAQLHYGAALTYAPGLDDLTCQLRRGDANARDQRGVYA